MYYLRVPQMSKQQRFSRDRNLPTLSRTCNVLADSAFSLPSATIWNTVRSSITSLPAISSFKTAVKIHSFQQAYERFRDMFIIRRCTNRHFTLLYPTSYLSASECDHSEI